MRCSPPRVLELECTEYSMQVKHRSLACQTRPIIPYYMG